MEQKEQQPQPLPPIPSQAIYINGFGAGLSSGDIFIVLHRNNKEIGVLNMSYTVAKSLAEALDSMVKDLEKMMGNKILTSAEISNAIAKGQVQPK